MSATSSGFPSKEGKKFGGTFSSGVLCQLCERERQNLSLFPSSEAECENHVVCG